MIQRKTLPYGLLAHRRYDFYGLRRIDVIERLEQITTRRHTFKAKYDRKMDSYQPNDSLSTIWLTSAPSSDLSSSADRTPFAKGTNLFSRQTAIWMGMRQRRSTSHSPTR